jgi:hypothetical protein
MRYRIAPRSTSSNPMKSFSVPFFWLALAIAYVKCNDWLEGEVTDTETGKVRISWALCGLLFGDGESHLTIDGKYYGPPAPDAHRLAWAAAVLAAPDEE